jgi:hypothetical protein
LRNKTVLALTVFLLGSVVWHAYLYFDPGQRGYYDPTFRAVVCHSRLNCLHEIGHALDHDKGWISQSREYRIALNAYILYNWEFPDRRDQYAQKVLFYPGFFAPSNHENVPITADFWQGGWGGTLELYADMFTWTGGKRENMPAYFVNLYDWTMAKRLIKQYLGGLDFAHFKLNNRLNP